MQQAIEQEGQTVDLWELEGGDTENGSQFLAEHYFKPYFKILNDCQTLNTCIQDKPYKYLNGVNHIAYNTQSRYKHLILSDGTLLIFHVSQGFTTCGTNSSSNCAELFVDLNGYFNGPNQFGKDFFVFALKKDRIVPYLPPTEQPDFSRSCNRVKSPGYGLGCAAWVLINENMDYLHCDDLQWDTKTTCNSHLIP